MPVSEIYQKKWFHVVAPRSTPDVALCARAGVDDRVMVMLWTVSYNSFEAAHNKTP